MGKPTSSCLKIITCGSRSGGGDSENEDLAETKVASENHRWSFRKKSAGHRVLSDTVISEPLSAVCDKETLQATTTNFDSPIHSNIPVKLQAEDKPKETVPLSPDVANSEVALTELAGTKTAFDDNIRESSAVVIQSAIRRYLARNEHLKLKNVVKLQAVVRGHIVRRQAVGTLRCVQAIVKMQALVRVRYARQTIEKSTHSGNSNTKADKAQKSIHIVISNGFARQLLESAPKQKPIYVKCEPSRPDSAAWEWLERWMAVTSSDIQEQSLNKVDVPRLLEETNLGGASEVSSEVSITDFPISSTSTLAVDGSAKPKDDDLVANTISGLEYQHPVSNPCEALSSSLEKVDQDNSHLEIQNLEASQLSDAKAEHAMQETSNSHSVETSLEQDEASESIPELTINNSDSESQSPKSTSEGEPVEIEGKRFGFGSRRMTNPAFAAVQSKFEELSSSQSVGRDQDTVLKSKSDYVQSKVDPLIKAMDYPLSKNSVSYDSKAQMASSECGTEISISSPLDSPERSETEGGGETALETGAFVKENHGANDRANNPVNVTNSNAEANDSSTSDLGILQPQKNEGDGSKADLTVVAGAVPSEKQTTEPQTSEIETHSEKPTDQLGYRSSPEGSPRSPTTILESTGISSSQNSVNPKSNKKDIVNQNQKAQIVEKGSPSTPINESGGRISTEQLPKDTKNAKRRTSFATTKSDGGVDHEPRLSSSKSLPSYMQATESAKAKAQGSISPKSSPDVHDKDSARKRHSLPIANGKQDSSPRMQRSTSQAQQNAKGERRWQR